MYVQGLFVCLLETKKERSENVAFENEDEKMYHHYGIDVIICYCWVNTAVYVFPFFLFLYVFPLSFSRNFCVYVYFFFVRHKLRYTCWKWFINILLLIFSFHWSRSPMKCIDYQTRALSFQYLFSNKNNNNKMCSNRIEYATLLKLKEKNKQSEFWFKLSSKHSCRMSFETLQKPVRVYFVIFFFRK